MASHLLKFLKQNIASYLLITATLLTSGLIINIVQVLLHIFVKPFNKRLFHHCMYYASWTWLSRKYWQAWILAIRILHACNWACIEVVSIWTCRFFCFIGCWVSVLVDFWYWNRKMNKRASRVFAPGATKIWLKISYKGALNFI